MANKEEMHVTLNGITTKEESVEVFNSCKERMCSVAILPSADNPLKHKTLVFNYTCQPGKSHYSRRKVVVVVAVCVCV